MKRETACLIELENSKYNFFNVVGVSRNNHDVNAFIESPLYFS